MALKLLFLSAFLIVQVSCGQNSLTFVIDQSASMDDEINQVRNAAKSIVDTILEEKSSQIEDIVLVTFRNHEDTSLQNVKLKTKTRDDKELKQALDSIDTKLAWCTEVTLAGIKKGLEESRLGSYMYVFTDTTATDYNMFAEIKALCQEKQIQIVIVLTGIDCGEESDEGYRVYFKIATACNGQLFRVEKEEVDQLLVDVKDTIKGEGTVIQSKTIPPNKWEYIEFTVDEHTESVKVSASGKTVSLQILNKVGEEISGTHLMWTRNSKNIKLTNLQPDTYRAKVMGYSDVTIRVVGRTDFQFRHGFSTTVQTNLNATDMQPTTAVETLLMVSVQDKNHSALIRKVELIDMQDRLLQTLLLTQVQDDIYKTDMFSSPEQTFKISVVAESKTTGRPVTRYAKTPVTPIESVAPAISKTENMLKVKEGSSVDVNCRIIGGKPRPQVSWYVKTQGATQFTSLQGTDEFYHVTRALTNDQYKCVAKNLRGQDEHSVTLDVQTRPKFQPSPETISIMEGESVNIDCKLEKGNPRPTVTWQFKPKDTSVFTTMTHEGDILHFPSTDLRESGEYKCIASNKEGRDEKITIFVVKAKPTIENPRSQQSAMKNTTISLDCRVRGFPKPIVNWFYKRPHSAKFEKKSRNTESLLLKNIQLYNAGQYKCVAENEIGKTENTVEVTVNAPPQIVFIPPNSPEYSGVEGDVAMILPCTAMGYPIPTITWEVDNRVVTRDQSKELYVKNDNLFLLNPKKVHSSAKNDHTYVCRATNNFGEVTQTYQVYISNYPDPGFVTNEIKLEAGESTFFPCSIPKRETDRLLLFKDGRRLPNSYLLLDVTEADAGTYTCRVSSLDRPAQSYSTRVEVGFEPRFEYPDDDKEIAFAYGKVVTLDCTATGVPTPEVKWYHDGREIEHKEYKYDLEMMNEYDKGRYTCIVNNSYGSVQQEFVISSLECLLDVTHDFNQNEPLMLTTYNKLPNFKTSAGYMRIPRDESIKLVCPTRFHRIRARELTVTCENDQQFVHQSTGRRYSYSDLKCRDKWQPVVKRTGHPCSKGNAELFNVGYEIRGTFQTVYGVCFDRVSKNPIYTKLDIEPTLANAVANNDTEWFNHGSPVDLDDLYDCTNQNAETSAVLNREFHRGDGCCFAKRMLVNPLDVSPGLQSATYTHLNVAPHWGTCDSTNWEDVERRIRKLVASADRTLQVYTGSAYSLEMPDAYSRQRKVILNSRGKDVEVPRYLWKIVQDSSSGASLAIIQVNVPDLKLAEAHSYLLCRDVCRNVNWMQSGRWRIVNHGFTYCCTLPDFERAFRMRGVFPRHNELLTQVSAIPDDHYLHAAI